MNISVDRNIIGMIAAAILVLILTPVMCSAVQSPQSVFDQANEHLSSGELQEALSLYQQLEYDQQWSGALFLNMGVTYQRMDSLGKAKYYYLKSTEFEETHDKANQALEYVNRQFSRQSATLPKLPWDRATEWLQEKIGAVTLVGVGILLLNIGVLFFIGHWFMGRLSQYLRQSSLIIIGLSIFIMTVGFYTYYVDQRYSTAVMVTQQTAVVENPNSEASLVSQAYEGYTFTVDHRKSEQQSNWSYVRMSNGLYGWIPTEEIRVL
ncbi:hypothetical protein LQ318_12165 [Aliifodinibius salicampi]|uniref:SH3 domain-containing protein n=1 Tax=Fodinibius salicampi TaxID=1920655 RepID=A0ABT3Q0L2_9BACT|nr:hypothetical protein [Fodinibius salicampi]MCW9713657.1 hypothetical protein [Fodinibius salicampi]